MIDLYKKTIAILLMVICIYLSSCENTELLQRNSDIQEQNVVESDILFSCSHQIELFDYTNDSLEILTSDDIQLYKYMDVYEDEIYFVKTTPASVNSLEIGVDDIYKMSLINRNVTSITIDSNYDFNLSVSQKTGDLLYTSQHFDTDPPNLNKLIFKNIITNEEIILYENSEQFYAFWSPDGTKIAIYQGYYNRRAFAKLFVYDMNTKKSQQYIEDELLLYRRIAWSPDSKMIAIPTEENGIQILEISSGDIVKSLGTENEPAYPEWSPDGKYITFETLHISEKNQQISDLWIYDYYSGTIEKLYEESHPEYQSTWSPDSKIFAYFVDGKSGNKVLMVKDFESDKTITEVQTTCGIIYEAKWIDSFINVEQEY